MKFTNNTWLPEFVYFKKKIMKLDALERWQRYLIIKHSKKLDPSIYRHVILRCVSIMNFLRRFKPAHVQDIMSKLKPGFMLMPLIKDANGGGMSGRSPGILHFSKTDWVKLALTKLDCYDEWNALSNEKKLTRLPKIIGPWKILGQFKVKLIPDIPGSEGLTFMRSDLFFTLMYSGAIEYGTKCGKFLKSSLVPLPYHLMKLYGMDDEIFVQASENKLKLSAEKLGVNFAICPELSPAKRYSRNIRNVMQENADQAIGVKFGFDLQTFTDNPPRAYLAEERAFYLNGTFNDKFLMRLFGYFDKVTKTKKLNRVGTTIKNGGYRFHKYIEKDVKKALLKAIKLRFTSRTPSIYGVGYSMDLLPNPRPEGVKIKTAWVTRFPWSAVVKTEYAIWNHCIFVYPEIISLFGGDMDGDQWAVFHRKRWDIPEFDMGKNRDEIRKWMKLPAKIEPVPTDESMVDTMCKILDQYSGCGIVFNRCSALVDMARYAGWSAHACRVLYCKLTGQVVQPFIDGFKYAGCDKVPTMEELAERFGVPLNATVEKFFDVVRGPKAHIDLIIAAAKDADPNSKSYYERFVAAFKDWQGGVTC